MNRPIDMNKVHNMGIDKGRARTTWRGYRIVSDGKGRGGVDLLDEDGIVGHAPSVGDAMRMIDRWFSDNGPEAA